MVPPLYDLPVGCRFAPRCPLVEPYCREVSPQLVPHRRARHKVACHVVEREGASAGRHS